MLRSRDSARAPTCWASETTPFTSSTKGGRNLTRVPLPSGFSMSRSKTKLAKVSKDVVGARDEVITRVEKKREAQMPLRGSWMYVVGYNPWVLGPSTQSTALRSILRPHLCLFAWGSKSEACALFLSLSASQHRGYLRL
jgi:hypothetical protein